MNSEQIMAWVDVETSGLNYDRDVLMEVAIVITDSLLNVKDGLSVVIYPPLLPLPGSWPHTTHTENDLIDECLHRGVSLAKADSDLSQFLRPWAQPGQVPMCGSTVHFDRRFLERDLPRTASWFHYRNIDVSTVKELWKRWFPGAPEAPRKNEVHRARLDIDDSLSELQFYMDRLAMMRVDFSDVGIETEN